MKVMRKPSSLKVTAFKKPSAQLSMKNLSKHDKKKDEDEGLDEKLKEFEVKGGDVNLFLAKLSKSQREAVWQRFAYARTTDPELQKNYKYLAFCVFWCRL